MQPSTLPEAPARNPAPHPLSQSDEPRHHGGASLATSPSREDARCHPSDSEGDLVQRALDVRQVLAVAKVRQHRTERCVEQPERKEGTK